MKTKTINYEKEVKKIYPKSYGQWALGHCIITDGEDKSISDLIKGCDKDAQKESWKNAYEKIKQKNTQKFNIQDFEAVGTLEQISKSLSQLAFDVSSADPKEIDDNNDEEQSFYDDGVVSCTLYPMA